MFINYNKITPFQTRLIKAFKFFQDDVLKLHNKEINEYNLLGTSKVSHKIQVMYIAILLGIIEYDSRLKIKGHTTDVEKFKSALACNGINLHSVYSIFGLMNNDVSGVNTLETQRSFIVEPSVFNEVFTYTKVDINELIEQEDSCRYTGAESSGEFHLIIGTGINTETHLEL